MILDRRLIALLPNDRTMTLARALLGVVALAIAPAVIVSFMAINEVGKRQAQLDAERSLAVTDHGIVEYVTWGSGPVVLVIHGAGGGFDQGRLLAEALGGAGFQWIAVSRFGYLGSDLPEDPSIPAQARAFEALLDQLQIETAHILAMSGGVPPALKFAELLPGRTGRMVLLSSAPFTPFGPDVDERPIPTWMYSALLGNDVVYWVLTRVSRGMIEEAFDARADLRSGKIPEEEAFVRELVDTFLPASKRVQGVINEAAAVDPSLTYRLDRIESQVLIVHAVDGRLNPFDIGQTLAVDISGSEFLSMETGGHLLLGHHAELRKKISEHLAAPRD
ncbi:MAG: alpha/beta hydrolase [Woeseiaceae bacterium]|nr:alpha/beta hydrolase [Woeseiaceae bacterium]